MNEFEMQPGDDEEALDEEALLDKRMDDICEGLIEGIEREVEILRREGWPIWVEIDGKIIDLQQQQPSDPPAS